MKEVEYKFLVKRDGMWWEFLSRNYYYQLEKLIKTGMDKILKDALQKGEKVEELEFKIVKETTITTRKREEIKFEDLQKEADQLFAELGLPEEKRIKP